MYECLNNIIAKMRSNKNRFIIYDKSFNIYESKYLIKMKTVSAVG